MALHDTVVKRIARHLEAQGHEVSAELRGYPKPPRFLGPRGRAYIPDVFDHTTGKAVEVKEYWAYRNAGPKLKAIAQGDGVNDLELVLCTGTTGGADRVQGFLDREGIPARATAYRDHPSW